MDIKKLTKQAKRVAKTYSEQFEIKQDNDWLVLKLQEEMGELVQSYLMMSGRARKKGMSKKEIEHEFTLEVADVFCFLLLLIDYNRIDLEKAVEEKWLQWIK